MAQNSGPTTVTITGTGFTNTGLSVSFSGTGVTAGTPTYVNSTSITVPVTVAAGAATGARDVTVTCSGQSGTGTGKFTVTPGLTATTTTVTPPSAITYGQSTSFTATVSPSAATGTVQFKVDGVNQGSPVALSSGTATLSNVTGLTAGNRSVTAVYSGDSTYATSTSLAVTQVVNKATQATVSVSAPASATYGQTGLSATASGGSGTGAYSYSAGSSTACTVNPSTGALTISGTGTCDITATRAADSNYNVSATSAAATVTVSTALLTVTAAAKSKTYGAADPALTYSASGFVNGDTSAIMSGSLTRAAGENVGNYAINQGSVAATSNYTIAYTGANLTIDPAALTVTAAAKSKTYGGADPALTYTATGFANGDTSAIMSGSLTRTAGENVGTYAINQGSVSAGSNYTITYTGANLTVDPATLAVTAEAKSKIYGESDPALTYGYAGLVNGDTSSVFSGSLARAAGETAGTYAINQGTLGAGSNYTVSYTGADLTVGKASLTVSAQNASRPYGEANPSFVPLYSGFVLGDTAAVLTGAPDLTTTAVIDSPVGSYPITASIGTLAAANYTFTFGSGTLAVGLASQTITFNPLANKTYGSAAFDLSATGGASGNPVTFTSSDTAVATISGATVTIVGTGSTTITANQAGNSNYASATAQQTLTIDKATLTVSAQNVSRPYNTDNPTFTPVYAGFVNGETATVLTGAPALSTTATKTSPTGSYPITVTIGTLAAANYTFSFSDGTLGIDVASQSISFTSPGAKTYGDAAFDLAATGGDSGNPVTFTSSNTAVATISGATVTIVGAGSTTITANQAGNSNYASATAQETLSVAKATLTVSAQPVSRSYNTANPAFTPAYTGFVNGETVAVLAGSPELTTTAVTDSPAGSYPITVAAGNLFAANYAFTYVNGTLTIDKANQSISLAASDTRTFGAAPYTLSATGGASGNPVTFVSSNLAVATVTGNTVTVVGAGITTITASQAGDANYNAAPDAFQALTVDRANQTITFGTLPAKNVGDADFAPGATASSTLTVTYASSNTAVATIVAGQIHIVGPGTTDITASQGGDANFNAAADVVQPLTVNASSTPHINMTVNGKGSVNSNPAGIACDNTGGLGCSSDFTAGPVTLTVAPSWNYDFTGWTGGGLCNGTTTPCTVNVSTTMDITATFTAKQLVRMPDNTYKDSIQAAYAAAAEGDTLKLRDQGFTENLDFNSTTPVLANVNLDGGYDADYTVPATGYTTITGTVTVTSGGITVSNIIIQ